MRFNWATYQQITVIHNTINWHLSHKTKKWENISMAAHWIERKKNKERKETEVRRVYGFRCNINCVLWSNALWILIHIVWIQESRDWCVQLHGLCWTIKCMVFIFFLKWYLVATDAIDLTCCLLDSIINFSFCTNRKYVFIWSQENKKKTATISMSFNHTMFVYFIWWLQFEFDIFILCLCIFVIMEIGWNSHLK